MPQSKRKFKPKKGKRTRGKMTYLRLNMFIVPLFIVLFLVIYMIVQFLGERFRVSPVIALGVWNWMTPGEAVLLFVFFLGVSLLISVNIVFYLLKKVRWIP